MKHLHAICALTLAAALFAPWSVLAQQDQGDRDSDWVFSTNFRAFDFTEPEPVERRSLDRTVMRARAAARYQSIFSNRWEIDAEARIAIQHQKRPDRTQTDTYAELKRLTFRRERLFASPFLNFEGGRFRIQDRTGWLYDTDIEALQIGYDSTLADARLGIASWLWSARTGLNQSQFFDDDPNAEGTTYLYFEYDYQWRYNHHLGFDLVYEDYELPDDLSSRISNPDDLTIDSQLSWLRLTASGITRTDLLQIDYAVNIATVAGDRRIALVDIEGRPTQVLDQELDGGIGWDFQLAARLLNNRWAFGFGYAGGDGVADLAGGGAEFAQPFAATNRDSIFGLRRYRYYGEVLVPRLSNIRIASMRVGYAFSERLWLEGVYHDYQQQHARPIIFSDQSLFLPNGISRDIGSGLDLILGGRIRTDTRLMLVAGVFQGGSAFDNVTIDPDGYRLTAEVDVRW